MEIFDVLHAEHLQLLENLEALSEADGPERQMLLETVADELSAHTVAEDEVLYDRLGTTTEMRPLILEAKQEHHVAGLLLQELLELDDDDERFGGKVKVLRELIEHHIQEEEDEMFDEARHFIGEAAESLAGEFLSAKDRIAGLTALERLIAADEKNEHKQLPQADVGEAASP